MKTIRATSILLLAAASVLTAGSGLTAPRALAPAVEQAQPEPSGGVLFASGDCYAIGAQQAAQRGGQLARATVENRGGRTVCVIVVLMPARDGERPRRDEIVVPLN